MTQPRFFVWHPLLLLTTLLTCTVPQYAETSRQPCGIVINGLEHLVIDRGDEKILGADAIETLIFPLFDNDRIQFEGLPFEKAHIQVGWREVVLSSSTSSFSVPNYEWSGKLARKIEAPAFETPHPILGPFRPLFPVQGIVLERLNNGERELSLRWLDRKGVRGHRVLLCEKEVMGTPEIKEVLVDGETLEIFHLKATLSKEKSGTALQPLQWQVDQQCPTPFFLLTPEDFRKTKLPSSKFQTSSTRNSSIFPSLLSSILAK